MSNNNTIWWILLIGWMAGSTWWHVCKIKQICDAPLITHAEESSSSGIAITPLHIMDGPALMLTSPGNFTFNKSAAEADLSGVQSEIDSLANYLISNPGRRLNIKGYYASTETNTTSWPDLGIARAENIKSYLAGKGIDPDRLTTSSELTDGLTIHNNRVSGAIDFEFPEQAEVNENSLANAQKFSNIFKPLDLYFPSGSSDYIKTADNEQFLEEARKFLKENKDKKLLLTGHTDNTGTADGNQQLSKERAEEVKSIFVASGITADQLITDAKGQSSPKATNATEAGKAANRRVTIIVQ